MNSIKTLFNRGKKTQNAEADIQQESGINYSEIDAFFTFVRTIGESSALQSRDEIDLCTKLVHCLGLPSHHDHQKNWDTLKTLSYVAGLKNKSSAILDAGSSGDSVILKWLALLGFDNLHACDIRAKSKNKYAKSDINFSVQDLTATNYGDQYFSAVTCISVIEHGVPLEKFISEMSRILMPSGYLLISTDFWSEPVDCTGIFPYGESMGEMKVFTPHELDEFASMGKDHGLELCSPLNLTTFERAVRWERVDRDYTFAFMAFSKAAN